jgi:hypothetical protein
VIVYDWGFQYDGRLWEQRSFVLLDEGFQINQPVIFPPERPTIRRRQYCPPMRRRPVPDGTATSGAGQLLYREASRARDHREATGSGALLCR